MYKRIHISTDEFEQQILARLQNGPMLQKDIAASFPTQLYMQAGKVMCDMDRRGLIRREKCKHTNTVTLAEPPSCLGDEA